MDPAEDMQAAPVRAPFPQTAEEFDADPRVSFSKIEGKYILEAEDEEEYEYDDALKRWVPVLDDALLEQQRQAYAVQGVDESEPAVAPKKRKQEYVNGEDEEGGRLIKAKKPKPTKEPVERKNTAVYVTNLPLDATVEEVNAVFSRCGVISEEIESRKPRVKLYANEDGSVKGDALILYFRPESVNLAIELLADTDFRLGKPAPSGKMGVAAADFSYKTQKGEPAKNSGKDKKKKIIKKTQKLNNKLADWDDDDPSTLPDTTSKWDKVVILKHMFTLEELEEDPASILDIKEDIRSECALLGEVTNVVLYDKEPDGVVSVRFSTPEAADACVARMHNRYFSLTRVIAHIATGTEKFAKSNDKKPDLEVDAGAQEDSAAAVAEEEGQRLERFGSWLEGDGNGTEAVLAVERGSAVPDMEMEG